MNKKRRFFTGVILLAAFIGSFFSGVAFPAQDKAVTSAFAENEELSIHVRPLTDEEMGAYLHEDLAKWEILALEVEVINHTADPFKISLESIDLPVVQGKEIAKKVLKNAIPRSIFWKVASFFFFPLTIPSTIDGVLTFKSHAKMRKTLTAKEVKEEIIPAYSSIHRVFYIPKKEYEEAFKMTLENQETLYAHIFETQGGEGGHKMTPLPVVEENYYVTHG